jgi:hypothetical protein
MIDPAPVEQRPEPTSEIQRFFFKGETKNDTYEKIGGSDDLYNVKTPTGAFQLSRASLKETLLELKQHAKVSVLHLDPVQTESFRVIVEALRLLFGSQALYDLVLADIRDIFSDITDIKPGTVAAYFIGCFSDDKFPGPAGCSPKCAASLPPAEGTPGYTTCDDLVLIYADGTFNSLNDKRSKHVHIYIDAPEFKGFTSENIKQLRDAEIETASLIFGNPDGSYREVTSPLALDMLPIQAQAQTQTVQTSSTPTSTSTTTTDNTTGIIFAVVLAIVIIVLLFVLYRAYGPVNALY